MLFIKNNVVFLKVRAAMRFLSVAFGLPYLLIELFDIGIPVVRTDGRSGGRSVGVRSLNYQTFSDG